MTKLQKYNQIILALAGTAVLAGSILLTGAFLYNEVVSATRPTHNAILNEAQLEEDRKAGIRRQKAEFSQVSFTNNIASDWTWSAAEVTVKTLKEPEGVEIAAIRTEGVMAGGSSSSYRSYWGRDITNLILWNKISGENRVVFEDRVVIKDIEYYGAEEMNYVLLVAVDTSSKHPALYHYAVASGVLTAVDTNGTVPTGLSSIPFGEGNVIPSVTLAVDADGNGKYDSRQEVTFPARFRSETLEIEPIVSDRARTRAQKILDGDAPSDAP